MAWRATRTRLMDPFPLMGRQEMATGLEQGPCVVGFLGGSVVENPPVRTGDTGDPGSIPGWGRFPGGGNGSPLQYSFVCVCNKVLLKYKGDKESF